MTSGRSLFDYYSDEMALAHFEDAAIARIDGAGVYLLPIQFHCSLRQQALQFTIALHYALS